MITHMNDRVMTVTEAARGFSDLVNRTYYRGESTVLVRGGEPVAKVVPLVAERVQAKDWLARWNEMPHLMSEEAESFGLSIESARKNLMNPSSPWD